MTRPMTWPRFEEWNSASPQQKLRLAAALVAEANERRAPTAGPTLTGNERQALARLTEALEDMGYGLPAPSLQSLQFVEVAS